MADNLNTMSLSRRAALAGSAALVGALASVPAAASLSPAAGIDQELVDLFREWQDIHARYEAVANEAGKIFDIPPELEAKQDALYEQVVDLEYRASGMSARTVHGLAAKARIISAYEGALINVIDELTQSLLEDIFALEEADNGRPRKNALAGGGNG